MSYNRKARDGTYVDSNIAPQLGKMNSVPWMNFEIMISSYSVVKNVDLFAVVGVAYDLGNDGKPAEDHIHSTGTWIPSYYW